MGRRERINWRTYASKQEKFFAYVYLFNLAIPAMFLLMVPPVRAVVGAFLILIFAGVYFQTTYRARRFMRFGIYIETALMLVMIAYLDPGYVWMIFYPVATIGMCYKSLKQVVVRIAIVDALAIGMSVAMTIWDTYTAGDWALAFGALVASAATGIGVLSQSQTMRQHAELRKANKEIEKLTQVAERDRISQDLHDVMGHELSMITLKAQLVSRLIDKDPQRAKAEVSDIEEAARSALSRVREYISDIRQPRLSQEWADAIKLLTAAGLECTAEMQYQDRPGDEETSQALGMCLREACTNVVRHSEAKAVFLRCWEEGGYARLIIADDGLGFRTHQESESKRSGNGVSGIRARIASVDGEVYFWSGGQPTSDKTPPIPREVPWTRGITVLLMVPTAPLNLAVEEGTR